MSIASRRWLLAAPLAAAAGAGLAALSPGVRDAARESLRALLFRSVSRPVPTGPHAVGFAPLTLDIGGSDGPVAVDLWYPAAPAAAGLAGRLGRAATSLAYPNLAPAQHGVAFLAGAAPAPLILYEPAWFSTRRDNSFTLANLASHGFVVAALDDVVHYPGAAGPEAALRAMSLNYTSEATMMPGLEVAGLRAAAAARVAGGVLDALTADSGWAPRLDPARIGVLGYSFGGAVATELGCHDPRVTAVVNLDGSTYGEAGRQGVTRPCLTLFSGNVFPTAQELVDPDPAIRLEAKLCVIETTRQIARAGWPGQRCFLIDAARHPDFSDALIVPALAAWRGPRRPDRHEVWSLINAYLVAFFGQSLRGEDPPLLHGPALPGARTLLDARDHAPRTDVTG
ncbi:MAG TPA: hypothetical protein VGM87_25055 [Roseomonas sp.]|jgi:dienelactone hydrolase